MLLVLIFMNLSLSDAIFKLKFFKLKRSPRFAETVMLSSDMTRTYLPNQFLVQVDLRGINHVVSRENRHPECWRQEIPLKSLEFYHLNEQLNLWNSKKFRPSPDMISSIFFAFLANPTAIKTLHHSAAPAPRPPAEFQDCFVNVIMLGMIVSLVYFRSKK